MPVDLDGDLAALAAALMRGSSPIALDELAGAAHNTQANGEAPPVALIDTRPVPRRGRRWVAAVSFTTAAAAIGAIALVGVRDDGQAPAGGDGEFQPDGMLMLDTDSTTADGWQLTGEAYGGFDLGWTETVTRRYATASPTPELDAAFDVRLMDADAGAPLLAPGESTVSIQGIPAWWLDTRVTEGMQLAFERDGYWFTIAGYRATEEEVITAAEHTRLAPDGPSGGAVVDPAGLPGGVTEQLVGTEVELWLYPSGMTDDDVRTLSWVNGDRTAWVVSVPASDDFVRMQRVPASTTADATVRGHPSFVATYEPQTNLRWMAWTEADRSYLMASNNLSSDELAGFANALRPATVDDWTGALAALQPDPDELIPVAVRYFPVVDETLVPDDGRGPTWGQYGQTEIGEDGMVALPLLQVHGGVVDVSVDPRPIEVLVDVNGGDYTATEVDGRPALGGGQSTRIYFIDLGDGTTLVVESAFLTRDELAPIAASVQLVDRDTWEATYDPWPPIRENSPPAPTTSPAETVVPDTDPVSAAPDVRELQQLLIERGFDPGPVDGVLGESTERAIWAAEKLYLGTPLEDVTGQPTPDLAVALTANRGPNGTDPRTPRRSVPGAAHVEIDLPSQLMVVYDDDVPVLITHVSTGMLDDDGNPSEYCETATIDTDVDGSPLPAPEERSYCGLAKTPGGVFEVHRAVRGERHGPLGSMTDPVYFNMGIAIHGARNVPMLPASHGGVRVPMHISEHLHDLMPRGTSVYVWNGRQEPEDVSDADRTPIWDWPAPTTTP